MSVQTVRWGYAVMAESHSGKILPILRWSPAWPRTTAIRHAKTALNLSDVRSVWIVVGRWTLEARWSFRRLDVVYLHPGMRRAGPPTITKYRLRAV